MPGSTKCGTYQKKNTRSFLGDCGGGKRNKEDGGGGGEERRHKDLEEGRFPSPAPDFGGGVAQLSRSCGQWRLFCADGGLAKGRDEDPAKDGTSGLRGARRAQLQARSVPGTGMKSRQGIKHPFSPGGFFPGTPELGV